VRKDKAVKYLAFCIALIAAPQVAAATQCFPVDADVVSLGEKAAHAYAERSLDKHIAETTQMIESRGDKAAGAIDRAIDCKHFPNVLGADEWRCLGKAKVCEAAPAKPAPAKKKTAARKKKS
jgi:hypothetical protein